MIRCGMTLTYYLQVIYHFIEELYSLVSDIALVHNIWALLECEQSILSWKFLQVLHEAADN